MYSVKHCSGLTPFLFSLFLFLQALFSLCLLNAKNRVITCVDLYGTARVAITKSSIRMETNPVSSAERLD